MAEAGAVEPTINALVHHLNRGVEAINKYLISRPAEVARPASASRKRALAR
jgi:hypothetical protein